MPKLRCSTVLFVLLTACSFAQAQSIDLAGYWKFDDDKKSSSVTDTTGTSDGIVHGNVKFEKSGVHDNTDAIEVDDRGSYIEIPHNDDFLLDEGTVVFWFKPEKTSGRQGIWSKDSSGYDTGGHLTIRLEGHHLKVRLQSNRRSYELKSKTDIKKNKWHHVAFVFGPGGMELYINGKLEKTNSYEGGFGDTSGGVGNFEPIVVGSNSWYSGDKKATPVSDHFHGKIDEVAILSNRLSSSTVDTIYEQTGEKGSLTLGDLSGPPPVYYVRKSGSDSNNGLSPEKAFKTIQHAVAKCSQPGATVYVGPGVYQEEVNVGKGKGKGSASGTKSSPIRLIADTTGKFTLDAPGEVILDGNQKENMGFEIDHVRHWVIQGFTIRNQTEYAFFLKEAGASILDCTMDVPKKYAIYSKKTTGDLTIADCVFDRSSESGSMIFVDQHKKDKGSKKVFITRNDMTMKNNMFMSREYYILSRKRNQNKKYSHGIVVLGTFKTSTTDIVISNNQISDCIFPILVFGYTRNSCDVTIANNTIVGSQFSIYVRRIGPGKTIATNNIIDTCAYGSIVQSYRGKTAVVKGILEHNITTSMTRYRRPYEFDVVTDNPLFVNPSAGDFSLQHGSPAIDVGYDYSYSPKVDIAGRLRPTDGNDDGIAQTDLGVTELVGEGDGKKRVRVVKWKEIGGDHNR